MWITVVCWVGGVGTCRLGGVGIGVKSMDDGDDNVSEAVVTGDKGVGSRVVTKSIKGVQVRVGVGLAGTGTGRVSEVVDDEFRRVRHVRGSVVLRWNWLLTLLLLEYYVGPQLENGPTVITR